ncbi:hypothetical protein ACVWYQ_003378 [Bradyrhizobium sp. USDA 3397]
MLSPDEFSVGCLADASGLSLVLPRTKYERGCLVTSAQGSPIAICLDGDHRFWSLPCTNNTAWKGVIIPNVRIELDENTLFDAEDRYPALGVMVRRESELTIVAKGERGSFHGNVHFPVMTGLPPSRENMAAGFSRWNVVLWRGEEKQVLAKVDITVAPT